MGGTITNIVFLANHGIRRSGAPPHPALALAHRTAEGLGGLFDQIDCDVARAAFEAVLEAAALTVATHEDARRPRPGRNG